MYGTICMIEVFFIMLNKVVKTLELIFQSVEFQRWLLCFCFDDSVVLVTFICGWIFKYIHITSWIWMDSTNQHLFTNLKMVKFLRARFNKYTHLSKSVFSGLSICNWGDTGSQNHHVTCQYVGIHAVCLNANVGIGWSDFF